MSFEEVREALDSLYEGFERGILLQEFGTAKTPQENAHELLEGFKMDGELEKVPVRGKSSYKLKGKKIIALVDTLTEFSGELFGLPEEDKNVARTYLELYDRYFANGAKGPIPDEFLKRPDFLDAYNKKLEMLLN